MSKISWWRRGNCRLAGGVAIAAALACGVMPAQQPAPPTNDVAGPSMVSPSGVLSLAGDKWGDKKADATGLAGDKVNHPDHDPGSLFTVTKAIGARQLWKHHDPSGRPLTGFGVTVALLDSGVSPVPGLDSPGKVVYGPDFTAGGVTNTGDQDAFGHGTFMAGLIAANDDPSKKDGTTINLDAAPPAAQEGLAPDAQLLSVKLAGADGTTSVDDVIAALAWVVQHRNDNGMNVRVVNLSFGATALQPYQIDPLAAAVEAAWRSGIVVVASAGNDGPAANGLTDPALDPFVIAVGSSDPQGKVDGWGHPVVAGFSSAGSPDRPVDLLAPGRSVVSLRVPGSTIDVDNPQGLVAGDSSQRLFRGSGTSEATAVVSGAVALLLQAHPELTPDQVKALLMATARPLRQASVERAGSGEIALGAALDAADKATSKDAKVDLADAVQSYPASSGLDGVNSGDLSGSWDGARWSDAWWDGARWSGARWSGARWSGEGWS